MRVPLKVLDVVTPEALELYQYPLVLVRPDQHIAWRNHTLPGDALMLIDRIRGGGQGDGKVSL